MWPIIVAGVLLIVLVWVTRLREGFISEKTTSEKSSDLPDPRELANTIQGLIGQVSGSKAQVLGNDFSPIVQKMQGLLSKYDNPEQLGHVMNVKGKDPGELARMQLNIVN
jgi:hypothetical protein